MLIVQSVIVGVIYLVLGFLEEYLSFPMCSRPMVVGSVIGFFLGDLKTGVMIGASLELVFMGSVQIGASTPPDSLVGTAVGTAFAIIMHADVEVALALAVPVALLVSMTSSIWLTLRTFWHPTIEKMMDKGDYKGLERMFYVVALTLYIPKALLVTFAIMAGSTVVEKMISIIPEFVTGGLGVAAGMMVAVGFAMLLKMMWSKKMCVYYFLGFLLVAYLNLPILAVAFFGVILCVILYFEGNFKMNKAAPEASEEEELFND
jgi:mannose/fructose/N-acetylgalactosamine-specific phosphotransferase system component IIC